MAPFLSPTQWGRGGSGEARDGEGDLADDQDDLRRSRRKRGATARARSLRQGDNAAEGKLWNELKSRKLGGYKFVRQLPIGPYFADFACRERRLVVELDGSQHAESTYDRVRDRHMQDCGYSVLRFWSHEAWSQTAAVCATILAALEGQLDETVARDLRYALGKKRDR